MAIIVGRVLDPGSKLALARELGEVGNTTLGEAIENKRHLQDGALLYDLATVYLEGKTCELGAYGRAKEGRNDNLQIVVGLLCNRGGIPISV